MTLKSLQRKIIDLQTAATIGKGFRNSNRNLVFTNGCFDILHAGHIALLAESRTLGDGLMIGLNTDAGIRRIKGPNRPVMDEESRSLVIAALEMVDWVVLFDEETPLKLIEAVVPKVLVKGGDYTRETVVGHEVVEKAGGEVVIIPLLEGQSTSGLLEKISGGE